MNETESLLENTEKKNKRDKEFYSEKRQFFILNEHDEMKLMYGKEDRN